MRNNQMITALIWFVPAVMLLLTLLPLSFPGIYVLALEIVVALAAIYIAYLLFTRKPRYYLPWGIAFIVVALVFNPIIKLSVLMGIAIPLSLITAIIFLANWWFVFRTKL